MRCRDPAEAGGFCRSDNDCESELRCSLKNKCFNSSLSLNVGDSCNPKATTMEKKCKESTDEGFGKFKLKCLENDGGEYMCHRVIDQFQACDFIKSQPEVCDEGLVCLSLGYYSVCAEQLF